MTALFGRVPARIVVSTAFEVSTVTSGLHSTRVLARDRRDAYASFMARADCPTCAGSGWKVVERTTVGAQALAADKPGASAGDPKMVWAVPCDCTEPNRRRSALAKARGERNAIAIATSENYETDNEIESATRQQLDAWARSLAQAKLVVQRFAQEFSPIREMQSEHGLLLMGPCGVGKTHLAVASLKEIVVRGHTGLFYDYRELLKEIQDSYNTFNQATEMSVLEPVLKTEFLVLDDVGSSKPSPWALKRVGYVLNTRYKEKRVTLLTTNFLDPEPSANQEPSGGTMRVAGMRTVALARTCSRSASASAYGPRLYEMCAARSKFSVPITARKSATLDVFARKAHAGSTATESPLSIS